MTFPAELERLKRAADSGDIRASECAELLRNHADAILGLVQLMPSAIEKISTEYCSHSGPCSADEPACYVREFIAALAKLNGEGK